MNENNQKQGKQPNFMKSNTLGLLAASEAHCHFGPARNHWEGGTMGECKIQNAKPLLHGRRGDHSD